MGASMRRSRTRRGSFLELHRITIGDYVILASAIFATISLFLPWLVNNAPGTKNEWAFTYSPWAAVIIIVLFLTALFLVIYPALSPDLRFPALPVSTPLIFLLMGGLMLLLFAYELGKYDCIECQGLVSRGIGVWIGLIASFIFIVGAVVKWGSRVSTRRVSPIGREDERWQ